MARIQDYFNEQINNFKLYHSNLLVKPTEEDIHKLRTTLKKLKTLNILLDGLLYREKDFPIELTNIFKLVGEIRDIQIQQVILKDYNDPYKIYIQYLYEHKLSHFKIKENFDDELKYLTEKLNTVSEYHIDKQIINNIKTRIKMSYDEIKNMQSISIENLHEVRIKIKRIFYTLFMLGELEDIEKFDKIQETIGLWHDHDVTIQNIKNFDNDIDIIEVLSKKRDSLYNESLELLKFL